MQLRLGSKHVWELVNFIGKSYVDFLQEAIAKAEEKAAASAIQLDERNRFKALKMSLLLRKAASAMQKPHTADGATSSTRPLSGGSGS